jgi:Calcineurin-like phosphoesterase
LKLQVLSDLHLESETYDPEPAPGADALVLAGDIDSTWAGLARFAGWPVPVLFVPGNHEFDCRELTAAEPALRDKVEALGMTWLERRCTVLTGADGRSIRFAGTVRWSDFDLYGAAGRARALRAGAYFQKVMRATRHGKPFDADAVREEALACRAWLAQALAEPAHIDGERRWVETVAITHFAPSFRSADPRYGRQPGTASFCNADDDLLPRAALWLHGHLHCRHDYRVAHADGSSTRVVCQARGLSAKGEDLGWLPQRLIEV